MEQLELPFDPKISDEEAATLLFMKSLPNFRPRCECYADVNRLVFLGLAKRKYVIVRNGANRHIELQYQVTDSGEAWANWIATRAA